MTPEPSHSVPEKPPPSTEATHARIVGQTVLTVFGLHHLMGGVFHHFESCQSVQEVFTAIARLTEVELVGVVALLVMLLLMLGDLTVQAFAYVRRRAAKKATT